MSLVEPSIEESLRERYEIERELGRGGMATVYLARDLRHGRSVAIKVLRPEVAAGVGIDLAFLRVPHISLPDQGSAIRLEARFQMLLRKMHLDFPAPE